MAVVVVAAESVEFDAVPVPLTTKAYVPVKLLQ